MKKILVLCGLPGSGKTTFAEQLVTTKSAHYFDGDEVMAGNQQLDDLLSNMKRIYAEDDGDKRDLVLDGLFLTNVEYLRLAEYFHDCLLEFHYWQENRQLCMENDQGRRAKDSAITIKYAPFEKPSLEQLKKVNHAVELREHQIIRKARELTMSIEYDEFKDKYGLGNRIESDRWVIGGTIRSCYGETQLTPEEPVIFKEFYELLEQIDSSLSYIQCRNIESECIDKEYKDDRDWYGGTANYAIYVCDVELLYEELKNRDII